MSGCLFTKQDWIDWENIDKRTKNRSRNFKAGKHSHSYKYAKCVFCGKVVVSYLISKHLEQKHRVKFNSWEEERRIIDRCMK